MRRRILGVAALVVVAYGCATTAPQPDAQPQSMHGVASWYGEEFAGRTTANGEIFDPALMTAAHRTLPFGTILEIANPKTQQSVWVRVNDRGPYIANRVIDLSYAAAQKISLIEPGIGEVDIRIVKMGSGEREPPAPMEVTIAEAPQSIPERVTATDVPPVEFPIPARPQAQPQPQQPVVVDRIIVEEQRGDVITRKQVGPDGRTIEEVPIGTASAAPLPAPRRAEARRSTTSAVTRKQFIVQVGAFAVESNAKLLQERLTSIGQRAWIDRTDLFRVRIGPFATRDEAADARTTLEASGLSAIIVAE
jgi:rare lipoprotein A